MLLLVIFAFLLFKTFYSRYIYKKGQNKKKQKCVPPKDDKQVELRNGLRGSLGWCANIWESLHSHCTHCPHPPPLVDSSHVCTDFIDMWACELSYPASFLVSRFSEALYDWLQCKEVIMRNRLQKCCSFKLWVQFIHTQHIFACMLSRFSRVWLCATLWTVARPAPLSMGFSRQEYWSGSPGPPPGDLPDSGIEPASLLSPALAGEFFTTSFTWEAPSTHLEVPYFAPGFTHSLLIMCSYLSLEKNFKVLPPDSVS